MSKEWQLVEAYLPVPAANHSVDSMPALVKIAQCVTRTDQGYPEHYLDVALRLGQEALRQKVVPLLQVHFLLQAVRGWWRIFLPFRFKVILRFSQENILVLGFFKGQLESCMQADLKELPSARRLCFLDVVRFLAERDPAQGIEVTEDQWHALQEDSWARAFALIRKKGTLVPFRLPVMLLVLLKRIY